MTISGVGHNFREYFEAASQMLFGSLRGVTGLVCKHDLAFHDCGMVRAAN